MASHPAMGAAAAARVPPDGCAASVQPAEPPASPFRFACSFPATPMQDGLRRVSARAGAQLPRQAPEVRWLMDFARCEQRCRCVFAVLDCADAAGVAFTVPSCGSWRATTCDRRISTKHFVGTGNRCATRSCGLTHTDSLVAGSMPYRNRMRGVRRARDESAHGSNRLNLNQHPPNDEPRMLPNEAWRHVSLVSALVRELQ